MKKNLLSEYRLPENEIPQIQKIELSILLEFQKVCQKLSLRFYLHGGTLLGAQMYGGFIPWDDDIDVSMPRQDYEAFLKEGQALLPNHLKIQTCYNDPSYTLCFCKIRDLRTRLVEFMLQDRKQLIDGVYIDIFPIDGMPSNKVGFIPRLLRRRIDMSYWGIEAPPFWKRALLVISILPLLFISANKATRLLDQYRQRRSRRYPPTVYLINRWFYPKDFYSIPSDNTISFCHYQMPCVENVHAWLLIDYPRYQTIPPEEERVPGHRLVMHRF